MASAARIHCTAASSTCSRRNPGAPEFAHSAYPSENRKDCPVTLGSETCRRLFLQQASCLLDCQPVADPDAQTFRTFHAANAGRAVKARNSASPALLTIGWPGFSSSRKIAQISRARLNGATVTASLALRCLEPSSRLKSTLMAGRISDVIGGFSDSFGEPNERSHRLVNSNRSRPARSLAAETWICEPCQRTGVARS